MTTIEGWEIERHETLVRRARTRGGYLHGPDGIRVKIRKQEFPYDIGILGNIKQGMGGSFLSWLWPFTATPSNEYGLEFETNGFEGTACLKRSHNANGLSIDPSSLWPPPDPDRMPRSSNQPPFEQPFVYDENVSTDQSSVNAFRRRQQEDLKRYYQRVTTLIPRRPLHELHSNATYRDDSVSSQSAKSDNSGCDGEGWRDSEGDRLGDFGVDEDAEFYDEDDIPLAELLRRRHDRINYDHGN